MNRYMNTEKEQSTMRKLQRCLALVLAGYTGMSARSLQNFSMGLNFQLAVKLPLVINGDHSL